MQLQQIRANLKKSGNILHELKIIAGHYDEASEEEKKFLLKSSESLTNQLRVIHSSLSVSIKDIKIEGKKGKAREEEYERITTETGPVYLDKNNKKRFLEAVGIEDKKLKEIKARILKRKAIQKNDVIVSKPNFLAQTSAKIFGSTASKLSKTSLFRDVERDIKKANMPYMLTAYISMVLLITVFAFIIVFAIALGIATSAITALRNSAIALVLVAIIFFLMISYPSSIVGSNKKKAEAELPFAISHMAAIASSKVEPSKIFSIMALTKEYPTFSAEVRKVVNQINIYGYDLTTALKNVSKSTPSQKVSDLFNGMATTVTSGGDLTLYLNEKAKNVLLDYRFSRERYGDIIGMYSDVYTALLIAAPLIFMLLLAVMSVIGSSFVGMSVETLANLGVIAIAILNVAFIVFLHLTQPEV